MNNSQLKNLAIKHLNSKPVKSIKKQLCENFSDKKQKKYCNTEFDKGFIKSFIRSYKKNNP
jgi:hypothetical protein